MSMPLKRLEIKEPSRWVALGEYLGGAGMLLAVFLGLLGNIMDLLHERLQWRESGQGRSLFWSGEMTRNFAERLSKATLPKEAAQLQRGLNWSVLGDLGPRVRMGCSGWWFLKDEFIVHQSGQKNAQMRAAIVARTQAKLAERGISLLLVTIPDKSRVERSNLCGLKRPPALENRLHEWDAALKKNGVNNLDLQLVMVNSAKEKKTRAFFLRTDTHWNEIGASAAASAIAEYITSMAVPIVPEQVYEIQKHGAKQRWGDLTQLAGLDEWPFMRGLMPDTIKSLEFIPVSENSEINGADDLFGDSELPSVALIGTSYSNASYFVGQLQYKLRTRIGNFALDGGNFSGAAREYFSSEAYVGTPPKVIIWEVPERVLQMPYTERDEVVL